MFSVSDRILVLGAMGTIRYVGKLPIWGNGVLAYGVEWDDTSRGKNNGEIDGVQYFSPTKAGAGSFIKANNKKIEIPCLFFDAIFQRYSNESNALALEETVIFGSKVVQNYGFGKLNKILDNVSELNVIMLDHQNIHMAGNPGKYASKAVFNAESLDLSSNLLTRWTEVALILGHFPKVQSVNLNGNRLDETLFSGSKINLPMFPKTVVQISLSATFIQPLFLLKLDLENATKIELSENAYTDSLVLEWSLPLNLKELDLSYNHIEHIPETFNNGTLCHVVLANNRIASIQKMAVFPNIKSLDLRRNPLNSFEEVDSLTEKFPNLCELRINDCPVFAGLSPDEMAFNLIGRLRCKPWNGSTSCAISKLNGSHLLALEITNAELYFISRVRNGHLFCSNSKRWNELLDKHGISAQIPTPISSTIDEHKIRLSVRKAAQPDTELFSRVFLQKNPVLRLKGIISKYIGAFILDFSLFYYINDDDSDYGSRETMDDDIATLQSHGFSQNQRIYIL